MMKKIQGDDDGDDGLDNAYLEERFEIQRILDKRINTKNGRPEYLVQWKLWPDCHTWEPKKNIEDFYNDKNLIKLKTQLQQEQKQLLQKQQQKQQSSSSQQQQQKQQSSSKKIDDKCSMRDYQKTIQEFKEQLQQSIIMNNLNKPPSKSNSNNNNLINNKNNDTMNHKNNEMINHKHIDIMNYKNNDMMNNKNKNNMMNNNNDQKQTTKTTTVITTNKTTIESNRKAIKSTTSPPLKMQSKYYNEYISSGDDLSDEDIKQVIQKHQKLNNSSNHLSNQNSQSKYKSHATSSKQQQKQTIQPFQEELIYQDVDDLDQLLQQENQSDEFINEEQEVEEEEKVFDKILGKMVVDQQISYLIQFQNCNKPIWMEKENLPMIEEEIQQYENEMNHKLKKNNKLNKNNKNVDGENKNDDNNNNDDKFIEQNKKTVSQQKLNDLKNLFDDAQLQEQQQEYEEEISHRSSSSTDKLNQINNNNNNKNNNNNDKSRKQINRMQQNDEILNQPDFNEDNIANIQLSIQYSYTISWNQQSSQQDQTIKQPQVLQFTENCNHIAFNDFLDQVNTLKTSNHSNNEYDIDDV